MKMIDNIKQHKLLVLFIIVAIASVIGITSTKNSGQEQTDDAPQAKTVTLVKAGDYRTEKAVELDNGIVESLGQAELRSQLSAPIARINVALDDNVKAGQALVELKNDDIRAQFDQAKAGLAAAQSRLDELKRGARPQDLQISKTALEQAQISLESTIKDSYAKSDDAIHNHIDKFFTNPRQSIAEFKIIINVGTGQSSFTGDNPQLALDVSARKYEIEKMLESWQTSLNSLDSSNLESNVNLAKENLQKQIDFMNEMAPLVNGISTENASYKQLIDGYKTEFSAARSTVSGSLASLTASETAWRGAKEALSFKEAGASDEQLDQAQAAVDQASASVAALQATLDKTVIRSPISGKVSQISGRVGELASPGALIASVVNPDALRIKTYVSENDRPLIAENDEVIIGENTKGIIQTIAPAINAQNKKVEVNVIITENSGGTPIISGQNVGLKILSKTAGKSVYLIPIQSIQFANGSNYAMTVDNGAIKQIPVTIGNLIGEKVEIVEGLEPDMMIASSVRGLKEGETVQIQE